MKKFLILLVIVCMVFSACQSSELPPAPGEPGEGQINGNANTGGAVTYVPWGYAPPEDVFDQIGVDENGEPNYKQIFSLNKYLFYSGDDENYLQFKSYVNHEGAYVWKYGYYYSPNYEKWIPYEFSGDTVSGSNWIAEEAISYVTIPKNEIIPGENYILSYSCKKQDDKWKCGCRDENICGYWMLNTIVYSDVDLPPAPEEPDSPTLMKAHVQPSSSLLEQGKTVELSLWFETSFDISQGFDDTMPVLLTKPDGSQEKLVLERSYDVYCNTNAEDARFSCNVGFAKEYDLNELGEYKLEIDEDLESLPEFIRVYDGGFKVVSSEDIDAALIREDIGSYRYYGEDRSYFGYFNNYYGDVYYDHYSADNTGVSVYVYEGENSKRLYFDNWLNRNTEIMEPETIDVEGVANTIFGFEDERQYDDGSIEKNLQIGWTSGNHTIRMYAYAWNSQPDEIIDVIKAYLGRYPATNASQTDDEPEVAVAGQILTDIETVIRNNHCFNCSSTELAYDVNKDGYVNAADDLSVRNIRSLNESSFGIAYNTILGLIRAEVGTMNNSIDFVSEFNVVSDVEINEQDFAVVRRALLDGRDLSNGQILSDMALVIWANRCFADKAPCHEFDMNNDTMIGVIDVLQFWAERGNNESFKLAKFMESVDLRLGLVESDANYISRFDVNLDGEISASDKERMETAYALAGTEGVLPVDTTDFANKIPVVPKGGHIVSTSDCHEVDFNADGIVAQADLDIYLMSYGSATDLRADANGNGVVGDGDYTILVDHWGETC